MGGTLGKLAAWPVQDTPKADTGGFHARGRESVPGSPGGAARLGAAPLSLHAPTPLYPRPTASWAQAGGSGEGRSLRQAPDADRLTSLHVVVGLAYDCVGSGRVCAPNETGAARFLLPTDSSGHFQGQFQPLGCVGLELRGYTDFSDLRQPWLNPAGKWGWGSLLEGGRGAGKGDAFTLRMLFRQTCCNRGAPGRWMWVGKFHGCLSSLHPRLAPEETPTSRSPTLDPTQLRCVPTLPGALLKTGASASWPHCSTA